MSAYQAQNSSNTKGPDRPAQGVVSGLGLRKVVPGFKYRRLGPAHSGQA